MHDHLNASGDIVVMLLKSPEAPKRLVLSHIDMDDGKWRARLPHDTWAKYRIDLNFSKLWAVNLRNPVAMTLYGSDNEEA